MITRTYLRPLGPIMRPPGRINASPDKVIRIGEREDVVFGLVELMQRHGDGRVDRRLAAVADTRAEIQRGGLIGQDVGQALSHMTARRAAIAGVVMDRPRIMGILNVTPDSFSDGGSYSTVKGAIEQAKRWDDEGVDFIDIGGESTRPGSDPVPLREELSRVMPIVEGLAGKVHARLSIDTRKAEVMRQCALAGAHIINDVSALSHDPNSLRVVADTRLPVILMHAQGDPKTMQADPQYGNVVLDVYDSLAARIAVCLRAGIRMESLLVDPGVGFGKTAQHNVELLSSLSILHGLGVPVVVGVSRKSFIGALTGALDPTERLAGSLAGALAAAAQGAAILRVHDVGQTRQALTVWQAVTQAMVGGAK